MVSFKLLEPPVRRFLTRETGARPRACILRQNDEYEPKVQREAEALSGAGFDVEVICMRGPGRPRRTVVDRVTVISLPADRHRGGSKARYAFDYGRFFVFAAGILAVRHVRRPYHVVQVNSMPDFLVFAALIPKLLGSRIIAYMAEPTPELAETLFGRGCLTRILALIEQRALRFADHSVTVTDQLKQRYVERGAAPDRITVVLNGADPGTMLRDELPTPTESKSGLSPSVMARSKTGTGRTRSSRPLASCATRCRTCVSSSPAAARLLRRSPGWSPIADCKTWCGLTDG